ncbi:MAG: hypothetical protein IT372_15085 [Polyangiaceae bacterium]|nr:hypothetical protein [Polyangiaceae bacterium]
MFWMHDVPFDPGASPFRCKGVLYQDTLAYFDERLRGGRGTLFGIIDDAKLRGFLEQRFVIGGFYDVFPLVALQSAAAQLTRMPYLELVREVARWQVPRQLSSLHKFLLKLASPEQVIMSLPRLAERYYDFLRVSVRQVKPRTYETIGCGTPAAVASAYMISSDVAIRAALDLTGATGVRIHLLPLEPDGEAHGIPVTRTRRQVSWA